MGGFVLYIFFFGFVFIMVVTLKGLAYILSLFEAYWCFRRGCGLQYMDATRISSHVHGRLILLRCWWYSSGQPKPAYFAAVGIPIWDVTGTPPEARKGWKRVI